VFVPVSLGANPKTHRENGEWSRTSKLVGIQSFRFTAPMLSEGLLSQSGKCIARLPERLRPTSFRLKLAQQPSGQLILRVSRKFGNPRERFFKESRHDRLS
jgi:hypothetical protein